MTRLAHIRHFKKIIAITFSISIAAVIACDVICGLGCASASIKAEDTQAIHQKHDHARHDHPDSKTTHDHSHDSTSDNKDDCCDDITNQFYRLLFKANDATIVDALSPALVFLSVLPDYKYLSTTIDNLNPEHDTPKIPPRTKGNYLRILISSFLI